MADHPIESQMILLAGTRASVPMDDLPALVERAQAHVETNREDYERRYERIVGARNTAYLLAEDGHWSAVGDELGFNRRETDAVQRAHEAQFMRDGRRLDREAEFESTLELREVVTVAADN